MKKSKLAIALILAATALVSLFALSACGSGQGQIQVHEHTYDSKQLVKSATCTSYAVCYRVCSECGALGETFDDVESGYAAHKYEWYPVIEEVTLCTGHKYVHLCSECSHQDDANGEKTELPSSDNWTVAAEPNEESEGKLTGICEECELPAEITLPRLNESDYDTSLSRPASCNLPGINSYVYKIDGQSFEFTVTTTVKHVLNGKEIASYSDDPTVLFIEDYLGDNTIEDVVSGKVENLGLFDGKDITCKEEGVRGFFTCDVKDCQQSGMVYFKKAHEKFGDTPQTEEQKKRDVAPKCDVDGVKYYTCSGCDTEFEEIIPKIGHAFEYELTKDEATGTWTVTGVCKNKFNGAKCTATDGATGINDSAVGYKQAATCGLGAIRRYVYNGYELLYTEPETNVLHRYYDSASKVDKRVESSITGVGTHVYDIADLPNIRLFADPDNDLCSENGNPAPFKCADCGKNFIVLVKYPHTKPENSSLITHAAATCTKDEITSYNCTACGEFVEIHGESAFGHDISVEIISAPTTTAEGKIKIVCKNAGCSLNDSAEITLAKLGDESASDSVKVDVKSVTETSDYMGCATRTVTTYTYKYKFGEEFIGDDSLTFTVKTDWVSGHNKGGAGQTIIQVRINDKWYNGYICKNCKKFIVVSEA